MLEKFLNEFVLFEMSRLNHLPFVFLGGFLEERLTSTAVVICDVFLIKSLSIM